MRIRSGVIGAASALMVAVGCQDASSPPMTGLGARQSVWVPDSTAVLAYEHVSWLTDATRAVVADAEAWRQTWTQVYGTQQPSRPPVNFAVDRVLVAALGQRPTDGFDIGVDSAVTFQGGTVVYVTTTAPGLYCVVTAPETEPVLLLRLPRPIEPIAFQDSGVFRTCLGARRSMWVPDPAAVLAHEYYSGMADAMRSVVADTQAWAQIWDQVYSFAGQQPPRPDVNFAADRVLVAALGDRPSSLFDIEVDSAVTFQGGTVVYVTTTAPGERCGRLPTDTQPVQLLRLPPTRGPITFRDSSVVLKCELADTPPRRDQRLQLAGAGGVQLRGAAAFP